ncbi:hypothetical protein [Candidatus Borreliella tachyglossi]|uniref:hypothetical protein n=1 Tax=Candidatus Borreliella tachyglossi TaxID=1964448 RepID=UPI004041EE05
MVARLERVPFLTLGTFNGTFEVTRETLENILTNFKKERRDIPIFIGHNDFFSSSRGAEAQRSNGWIDEIILKNNILYFSGAIDEELYSLIDSGALRGCSGEFHVKDKEKYRKGIDKNNHFLGGMAILGSDIPAVDIAKVSKKNLVKTIKRKFLLKDIYLNEGVYLSSNSAKILFEANLNRFLNIKKCRGVGNMEEVQGKLDLDIEQKINESMEKFYKNLEVRIKELVAQEVESLAGSTEQARSDSASLSGLTAEQFKVMQTLSDRLQALNANFTSLSDRKSSSKVITNYITTCEDLVGAIKLHQRQNNIASFGDAEIDFKSKNANRIKIEQVEER